MSVVPWAMVESVTTAPLSSMTAKLLPAAMGSLSVAVIAIPPVGVPAL